MLKWDFMIVADGPIKHNCPDITLVDKSPSIVKFIDVAIPGDCRVRGKITEKKDNTQTYVLGSSRCGSQLQ